MTTQPSAHPFWLALYAFATGTVTVAFATWIADGALAVVIAVALAIGSGFLLGEVEAVVKRIQNRSER